MTAKRPSWIRRFFGFIFLRFIPLIMILLIVWSGYQVAQAVVRQFDERSAIQGRAASFGGTATAIAHNRFVVAQAATMSAQPTLTYTPSPTETPEPTPTPSETATATNTPTATDTPPPTATATATDTPIPTDTPTATNTTMPTPTPTETPEPTPTPTNTPEPTATETEEQSADEQMRSDSVVVGQLFATNTPRPVIFATNTPEAETEGETVTATDVPLPTDTPTPPPTEAPVIPTETPLPTATAAPTLTPLPTIAPTATPEPTLEINRPLPTPLLPQDAGGEGRILNGTAVPTIVPLVPRDNRNLLNIMLLGVEDELADDNFPRTDTMIVVSINRDENTVSMLSLPRDLFVYIPTTNGMMQRINVAYGIGEVDGYVGGGFGLLRQTIFYNFGINVHYYAEVNFSGFRDLIDAIGGVEIAVDCAYEDFPLIGAEVPDGAERTSEEGLRTLDIGVYEMNGAQALWYARTRRNSSDFDRGRRQQQLLRAIWRQSVGQLSLTNAPQLWTQLTSIVETDMGIEEFISLIPIALNLDVDRIRSYTLIPTYHTNSWQAPDGANVQLPVYDTMRPLLENFYRPPTSSQILIEGATVAVYNGTQNPDWDRVAAQRLAWEGFRAVAMGGTDPSENGQSQLIDFTGQQKGGSMGEIAKALNVRLANIEVNPDPNRSYDFVVILGEDYNSCNIDGVLSPDELR